MSERVVRFDGVGKMYKVFPNRRDNLLDAIGLPPLLSRRFRSSRYREFWALRGIDFELRRGERLGIIGRNGAGKSTLLKLVTGNLPPTEGTVDVTGDVQALLEIGGGLHPEFTGNENIRASLGFLGLSRHEIAEATRDIAEFTELGRFLDQPFKTYSQGMQARLSFGIATAVQPEILIVDEILGAGDAYFFTRSMARMRELIEGGASVLLVTHALEQVVRFCDETIWLDRGRIVMRGPSTEVVKAYERFIREQEDRRLLAKNRKTRSGAFDAFERESYTEEVRVELRGSCDVREIALVRNGSVEDRLALGDAQDADPTQSAALLLEGSDWSQPLHEERSFLRRLEGTGSALFRLWFFYPDSEYTVDVTYRGSGEASVRRGTAQAGTAVLTDAATWRTERIRVRAADDVRERPAISRWPGEGSLVIRDVLLLDGDGNEQAVFPVGTSMRLLIRAQVRRPGRYDFVPAAVMYRADGILVSNHVGDRVEIDLDEAGSFELALEFAPLNLGDGRYVFSVALYRRLSQLEPSELYDLLDRSYEFEVTGNGPFENGVFKHAAAWSLQREPASLAHRPQ
jgi:lipopolysaccharide transport system ATP-binding protein